jgi:NhaP-type Na+/H+ or K+/H+ antiporter
MTVETPEPTYEPAELLREGDPSLFEPSTHVVVMALFGFVVLATILLPRVLARRPLTMPMMFLALGALFALPVLPDPPAINERLGLIERLTELGVIISLFSAGLKLRAPFARATWSSSWRLLAFTMPLTIGAIALLGRSVMGLPLASAILLGAVLAPTDPVLASDTQENLPEDPDADDPEPIRTALTSEAGLNDGLAFPFTHLAIAIALLGPSPGEWLAPWLLVDVVWKIGVGAGMGALCGWLFARVVFAPRAKGHIAQVLTGAAALPVTLITYALTEMVSGYGFIAVFVAACVIRSVELRRHQYRRLHDFAEDLERILAALLLVMLGAAMVGPLFDGITWPAVLVAALSLLVVRPGAGLIGLIGDPMTQRQRVVTSFLGIRGIGSIYYFAYALNHADFEGRNAMWATLGLAIAGSIVIHGLTARPLLRWASRPLT